MQTRAELIFASRVAATDGDCGPLTGALVDLRDERVAALLLEAGAPGEDPRLVPTCGWSLPHEAAQAVPRRAAPAGERHSL